jgi:hypothetical protein
MLNELSALAKSILANAGRPYDWHKDYGKLPNVTKKAPFFRIWLSDEGSVSGAEEIGADLAAKIRKYGRQGVTFPAFNLSPLYRLTDAAHIKSVEEMVSGKVLFDYEKVKPWLTEENDNRGRNPLEKLRRCLGKATDLLKIVKGQCAQMEELARIVGSLSGKDFMAALEKCALENLGKQKDTSTYLKLLFHFGNAQKKKEDDAGALSVILDMQEWRKYGHPIASEHTTQQINDILMRAYASDVAGVTDAEQYDAFGAAYSHVGEKMPEEKLPVLGAVKLRSMFNQIPCQYRYGKIEDASYPIAKDNRMSAKSALKWIAEDERKGLTWRVAGDGELVFAYPSKLPDVPPKLAALFAPPSGAESTQSSARFEAIAKEVINSLLGTPSDKRPDNIRVFSIKKMDKARSKVVFTRDCSPEWLIQCAEDWQAGCKNLPILDSGEIEHRTPFPLETPNVINNVWRMDGTLANTGKTKIKRMQPYQGLELLLAPVQKDMIRYWMSILVSHAAGLAGYAGGTVNAGKYFKKISPRNKTMPIAHTWAIWGLLLSKGGYVKEDYMESAAYLTGQMLKISDELHALYCKIKREGDVPPQLAGNSMFVMASETPVRALAQLSVRMNPYVAWAKQYMTKNINDEGFESWRAGWYMKLYEGTADKLYVALTEQTRFDDFQKAQFFIGYLAKFPKSTVVTASPTSEDKHEKEAH